MSLDFGSERRMQMIRRCAKLCREGDRSVAQELDDKEEFSYTLTRRMEMLGLFGPSCQRLRRKQPGIHILYYRDREIARIDGSQGLRLLRKLSRISPIYYTETESREKSGFLTSARQDPSSFWRNRPCRVRCRSLEDDRHP